MFSLPWHSSREKSFFLILLCMPWFAEGQPGQSRCFVSSHSLLQIFSLFWIIGLGMRPTAMSYTITDMVKELPWTWWPADGAIRYQEGGWPLPIGQVGEGVVARCHGSVLALHKTQSLCTLSVTVHLHMKRLPPSPLMTAVIEYLTASTSPPE